MYKDNIATEMRTGMIVGRFQGFHNEHYRMIKTALSMCEKVVVFIGSAQEYGTERNPFHVSIRKKMIEDCFKFEVNMGQLIVKPLEDLTNENDISEEWGNYVLENFKKYTGKKIPSCMFYGKTENGEIDGWFDKRKVANSAEFVFSRNHNKLSATKIRQYIIEDKYNKFVENTPHQIHGYYNVMRCILMNDNSNKAFEIAEKMIQDRGLFNDIIEIINKKENYYEKGK